MQPCVHPGVVSSQSVTAKQACDSDWICLLICGKGLRSGGGDGLGGGSGDGLKSRELSSGGDRLGSVFGDGLSGGGGNGLGPGSGGPAAVSDWTTAIDSVAVK